jgi:hypothetical protein
MGLTALEAMACGAAVIVPRAGGSDSFARHEHNALVVDTASPQACLAALDRLIGEPILRDRLRWQAISDVCNYFPERAAYLTLEALFPGTAPGPRAGAAARASAGSGNGAAAAPGRQSPKRRRGRPGAGRTPQRKRVVP